MPASNNREHETCTFGFVCAPVTIHLPFAPYRLGMSIARPHDSNTDLSALEATAATARAGFACMFSTSDEYESALIAARRAEGRYQAPFDWQPVALIGCVFILSGLLLMAL